ncbi:MAG: c-type cytochrome [Thiogranum sp.]|nr:c-type cytochrome [Thiogranum sp.]
MAIQRITGVALIAGSALCGMTLLNTAQAADVQDMVQDCETCHGKDGISSEPTVPTIAGSSAFYASDTMIMFQEEDRPCEKMEYPSGDNKGKTTSMCEIADDLSADEITALAEYYANKPFVPAKQDFDASLVEKGAEIHDDACEKCHAEGGTMASDDSGILAGQWTPYLRETFEHYSSGERPMTKKMKKKFEPLNDEEKEALLNYYASQQ